MAATKSMGYTRELSRFLGQTWDSQKQVRDERKTGTNVGQGKTQDRNKQKDIDKRRTGTSVGQSQTYERDYNKRTETIEGKCCRKIVGQGKTKDRDKTQDRNKRKTGTNVGQGQTKRQRKIQDRNKQKDRNKRIYKSLNGIINTI